MADEHGAVNKEGAMRDSEFLTKTLESLDAGGWNQHLCSGVATRHRGTAPGCITTHMNRLAGDVSVSTLLASKHLVPLLGASMGDLWTFNDAPGRAYADIRGLLVRAIDAARKAEAVEDALALPSGPAKDTAVVLAAAGALVNGGVR